MKKSLDTRDTTKYTRVKTKKGLMSQLFDENSFSVPFTGLKLNRTEDVQLFEGFDASTVIKIEGRAKGRGFQGVMKRWGFSGGPATHGTKDKHRGTGSIGTQGHGRVIPGKKMPGRMGNDKVSVITRFLGIDAEKNIVMVKGAVPGSINSDVIVYLPTKDQHAN